MGVILLGSFFYLGKVLGKISARNELAKSLPGLRKELIQKSKSIIRGQVAEQLAPILPDFPFHRDDCHFIGKPVDFLVFKGFHDAADGKSDAEQAIIFVEVKTGRASLSPREKLIKDAVMKGKIFWYEYRLPFPETKQ